MQILGNILGVLGWIMFVFAVIFMFLVGWYNEK